MSFAPPRDFAAPLTWPAPFPEATHPLVEPFVDMVPVAEAVPEVVPAPEAVPAPLSETDVVRFLQRASFGPRPSDISRVLSIGVDAWLDEQLALGQTSSTFERSQATDRLSEVIWEGMFSGEDQLRRRVAYALSQIFVVSDNALDRLAVAHYADVLEEHAFGTYRNLIEQITLTYAMGHYLTYEGNRQADERIGRMPDENYAREILQLFSIGLDLLNQDGTTILSGGQPLPTYGQEDILGLARVFTGWVDQGSDDNRYRLPLVMDANRHAPEEKSFLGTTIPAGTDGVTSLQIALDTIAAHANVAPFISRQLIQRLVKSDPSPAYVGRISAVFRDDGTGQRGNLGAVVRAILVDDEAWVAPGPNTGKLREPVLRFTTLARAVDVRCSEPIWPISNLSDPDDELGQSPYQSPSVFNFYRPGYVPPQSPLGDAGITAPEFQLVNEVTVLGWMNYVANFLRSPRTGITFDEIAPLLAMANDPPALVARLNVLLCAGRLDQARADAIVSHVERVSDSNAERQANERVVGAMCMVAATTDFLIER